MKTSVVRSGLWMTVVLCGIVPPAPAATVTWKSSISSGDWHTVTNWDTGAQPVAGDTVFINNGTLQFWGSTFGGMHSNIRNNSQVTINGGDVVFEGNYGANIGTGGTGTASSLNVISGAYRMGGNLSIGNASGETGTLTIGESGLFNAGGGSTTFSLFATGTVNSSGTVTNAAIVSLQGGVLNINGGTFAATSRIDFSSNIAKGAKVNISGGTLTANNSTANLDLNLGFGDRYFNFLDDGSTGTLILPNVTVEKMNSYLTKSYIRLNGLKSVDSFIVSSFGANGSQVSLPEPGMAGVAALGLALLARRRPTRGQIAAAMPAERW